MITPLLPDTGGVLMRVNAFAGLRLRAVPAGDQVRLLAFGEQVTVFPDSARVSSDYTWVVLRDALGNTGWAADLYLDPIAPPEPVFRLKNPVGCAHIISSKFGVPRDYDGDGIEESIHEGLDVTRAHADCTPLIRACADGVVWRLSTGDAYGNCLQVKTVLGADTYVLWYAHLSEMFVMEGQRVQAGDVLGVMGSTGNSSAPHLHLNVQRVGAPTPPGSPVASVINPEPLIDWE